MLSQKDKDLLKAKGTCKTITEWTEYFNGKYTRKELDNFFTWNKVPFKKHSDKVRAAKEELERKHHYFSQWSEDMAYILGLMCATGGVRCRGSVCHFVIILPIEDAYLLKEIDKRIGLGGDLKAVKDHRFAMLDILSKQIYMDVIQLVGDRPGYCDFPSVPPKYLPAFVRGYFDGNGKVELTPKGLMVSLTSPYGQKFLKQLYEILRDKAGAYHLPFDPAQNIALLYGTRDSLSIKQFIYNEVRDSSHLYLRRKREKFHL